MNLENLTKEQIKHLKNIKVKSSLFRALNTNPVIHPHILTYTLRGTEKCSLLNIFSAGASGILIHTPATTKRSVKR